MAGRTATLTAAGQAPIAALNGGIQTAFGVAAILSVGTIVLAFFIRNSKPDVDEQSSEWGAGQESLSGETAATGS
jgi:hypothetical protein